jgi:hypothetical protein
VRVGLAMLVGIEGMWTLGTSCELIDKPQINLDLTQHAKHKKLYV